VSSTVPEFGVVVMALAAIALLIVSDEPARDPSLTTGRRP
jgi:hypothetical protein